MIDCVPIPLIPEVFIAIYLKILWSNVFQGKQCVTLAQAAAEPVVEAAQKECNLTLNNTCVVDMQDIDMLQKIKGFKLDGPGVPSAISTYSRVPGTKATELTFLSTLGSLMARGSALQIHRLQQPERKDRKIRKDSVEMVISCRTAVKEFQKQFKSTEALLSLNLFKARGDSLGMLLDVLSLPEIPNI